MPSACPFLGCIRLLERGLHLSSLMPPAQWSIHIRFHKRQWTKFISNTIPLTSMVLPQGLIWPNIIVSECVCVYTISPGSLLEIVPCKSWKAGGCCSCNLLKKSNSFCWPTEVLIPQKKNPRNHQTKKNPTKKKTTKTPSKSLINLELQLNLDVYLLIWCIMHANIGIKGVSIIF